LLQETPGKGRPGQQGVVGEGAKRLRGLCLAQVVEGSAAGVLGHIAQVFLDAQQLVVLGDAVGAAQEPVLI
jgi:hypothetical protein